jgi:carotenoid cleavage dioxygenase-like enzyme
VKTPKWRTEHEAGQALWGSWGNPMTSDPSVIGRTDGAWPTPISSSTPASLMALVESNAPFAISHRDMEPEGFADFGGKVTAHPKTCPITGEMVFFAYADDPMPLSSKVSWGVADAAGKLIKRETFEAPYCSMIHDFAVTRDHMVIPVLPLTGSLQRAMGGKPVFAWEPEKGGQLAVMRRDQGVASLRWIDGPEGYVFHVMNAFDEGETIIVDVMRYASAPLFPNADGTRGENAAAYLVRWTIDLAAGTVTETPLDDLAGEFPRFDERLSGCPIATAGSSARACKPGDFRSNIIAHIDLDRPACGRLDRAGRRRDLRGGVHARLGRRAGGRGLADGGGLSRQLNISELVVLDARNVAAGPVASAKLPRRVPFGFHGNWVDARGCSPW